MNNQNDIVKIMFNDERTRTFLCMPVKMNSNQTADVLINTDLQGVAHYKSLKEYRKINRDTYGYFLTIVDLSAELCLGRNQLALRSMLDMYNFDSVKIIIQDDDLPEELRALFLRLLLNLHMDQKLEPI